MINDKVRKSKYFDFEIIVLGFECWFTKYGRRGHIHLGRFSGRSESCGAGGIRALRKSAHGAVFDKVFQLISSGKFTDFVLLYFSDFTRSLKKNDSESMIFFKILIQTVEALVDGEVHPLSQQLAGGGVCVLCRADESVHSLSVGVVACNSYNIKKYFPWNWNGEFLFDLSVDH